MEKTQTAPTTIHPSAIVDEGAQIGEGTKVWHWTHVSSGAVLGERCSLGQNVYVGNRVVLGNNVRVQNNVSIYDNVTLEDDVFCGPSMVFTNVLNPRAHVSRKHEYRNTLVRKGASIGANATVVCGTTIGRYAFIGAGAVVSRNVPDHALMVAAPAGSASAASSCPTCRMARTVPSFTAPNATPAITSRHTPASPLSPRPDFQPRHDGAPPQARHRPWAPARRQSKPQEEAIMLAPLQHIDFIDLKQQYRRLKPAIDERMQAVLNHGQYIMGPEVAELEKRLAEYVGVRHAIGISDGTTALQVAMMALGIGPGDEVITTPFTFIATAETISLLGATPVFVDIDPDTCNLDASLLEAAITPRTRAIIPVSLYGQCADMEAINAIAARHGLPVIEDGAQSFGATRHGKRSGGLSTIGCTSFFPSKPLGCYGDGGACFTNDDELGRKMSQIRLHGQSKRYVHSAIGVNGRLDTLQAAVLLVKLDHFDEDVKLRAEAGARYARLLANAAHPQIRPVTVAEGNTSVYAQYTVRVPNRAQVIEVLKANGVPTAVHYPMCLHKQPVYAGTPLAAQSFPHAEKAADEVLSLPMYPDIDHALQAQIIDHLVAAVESTL